MFVTLLFILFLIISLGSIKFVKCSENNILNIDTTTQLRGIAIIGILFAHVINNVYFMRMPSSHPIKYIFGVIAPLGVAVFLFLSGYGNVFSFKKNCKYSNFLKKIIKLYIPFGVVLCSFFVIVHFWGISSVFPHKYSLIKDFITLYLPPYTFWYLQVQLLAYITLFIFYKLSNKYYDILLTIFWIAFVIFCILTSKQGCWWVSTMCFPLGVYFAKYKDIITHKIAETLAVGNIAYLHSLLLCILTVILFVLSIFIRGYAVLILCLIVCLTFSYLTIFTNLKSSILNFCGKHSLEIYLIHFALMYLILQIRYNYIYINIINSILVISLSLILAYFIKNISDKILMIVDKVFFK